MTRIQLLLCLLSAILLSTSLDAQDTPRRINIKKADVKNISTVKITVDDKEYPESMLYRARRGSVQILPSAVFDDRGRSRYLSTEIDMSEIDQVIIYNRKRKIRSQIIGGIVGGLGSYFIVDQFSVNRLRSPTLEILGQTPDHRFVEPIAAGFLGAGLGIIIGELLSPIKLDARKDRTEMYRKLREFSYR